MSDLSVGKQMMSQSKFYMGYSRWDDVQSRYETWEESIDRVMDMHREKYKDTMTDELEQLIQFAGQAYKEQRVLGAQRALQFGGEQIFKHESRMYNCFHEDVDFVTTEGVRRFSDFADGDTTTVLTHTGQWKPAVVRSYGTQSFNKVTFSKQKAKKSVLVTGDHRWLLKNGDETTDLQEGQGIYKPANSFADFVYEDATPEERLYWCYGLVYGDGARIKDKQGNHRWSLIRLCGEDKQFASRFEEMGFKTSTNHSLNGDYYAYTGSYLKDAPDPSVDSPELIRAFVAGYLQADAEKNRNDSGSQYLSIQSSEDDHINFIRECFPIAGVWIISETDTTGTETNFGSYSETTIKFRINDNVGSKYNTGWYVSSIEEDIASGTAWCLEVEDDRSFVLPFGLVTGNCSVSHADRPRFFQEAMYLLLSGCGVGFSVQKHHVAELPQIKHRFAKKSKVFTVPDTIEGWADAFGVLLSSYFVGGGEFPEYEGCQVRFDLSDIRPKGAYISGGFKAPGPDGLRDALNKCEDLLEKQVHDEKQPINMRSIVAYDFVMHMSDAVLSGGVRRSATICLFSKDDEDMLNAKTGSWFIDNPQRGRSNNSVVLLRDQVTREEWAHIMESVKQVGEPGFVFTDNLEHCFNPCLTGDALVTVRDHDVHVDGQSIAEGQPYQIRMDMLVDIYNSGGLCPLVRTYNTNTHEYEWSNLLGAALTRKDAEVFEITDHETGKTIKATEDHLIWTKNRGYVEVKNLVEDDELLIQ